MNVDPFDSLASDAGIAAAAAEHSGAWEAGERCATPGCDHPVFDPEEAFRLRMGDLAFEILSLAEYLEGGCELGRDQALKLATDAAAIAAAIASNEACM